MPTSATASVSHIVVFARRWFDRKNGNTYHTVRVIVDDRDLGRSKIHYGYGEAYTQTAIELLIELGTLPEAAKRQPLWRVCSDAGIKLTTECTDVATKKAL